VLREVNQKMSFIRNTLLAENTGASCGSQLRLVLPSTDSCSLSVNIKHFSCMTVIGTAQGLAAAAALREYDSRLSY
jgi:hypothetical protein